MSWVEVYCVLGFLFLVVSILLVIVLIFLLERFILIFFLLFDFGSCNLVVLIIWFLVINFSFVVNNVICDKIL